MLKPAAARAARPGPRAYRLADGAGLYLEVRPTSLKFWRMRWRDQAGREQLLTFGQFPEISIEAARARRDQARAAIAAGDDPRGRTLQIRNVEPAFRAWHARRAPGWTEVHAADVLASLENDVFPAIGAAELDAVTPPAVLELLEEVEARGAIATARRVRQRIEEAFAFAKAKGWASIENPAAEVGAALANAPAEGRQAALVDVAEIRALMAAVDELTAAPALILAHRFLALTGVRLAALRGARWDEIEADAGGPVWRVPAARMKLAAKHKGDAARDHLVPLSAAAAAVLHQAANLQRGDANSHDLIFCGRGGAAPIGAGALGELYARAGFAGRHVPHGWRASFSTVMNRRRREDRFEIDRTLGHQAKGMTKVERAYNRAQHLELRRSILEEWAAVITG